MKISLGLDLGVGSVGWALIELDDNNIPVRIIDCGCYIFNQLQDPKSGELQNKERREKRASRRLRRRKTLRLKDLRKLYKDYFDIDFLELKLQEYGSPFEIKVKGLSNQLSKEELAIALYHYMKYRGFKSSRKNQDNANEGVMLDKITSTGDILAKKNITISEYLLSRLNDTSLNVCDRRIHNQGKNYYLTVSRAMYLDEIDKLLNNQLKYGVVNNDFIDKYKTIFTRQRDFSEGPGMASFNTPSPFGAKSGKDFLRKNIGVCKFDNNLKAPKQSYSAEAFVLLSYLNNFKYKTNKDEKCYSELTADEIQSVFEAAKTKKLTYELISKTIGKTIYRVKGVSIPKKFYKSATEKFKKKEGITDALPVELYEKNRLYVESEFNKNDLKIGFNGYKELVKTLSTKGSKEEVSNFIANKNNLDKIAEILLTVKTDKGIKEAFSNEEFPPFVSDAVENIDSYTKTINLSIEICQKLIPYMLAKNTYDKAMALIGYSSTETMDVEKKEFLPKIDVALKEVGEDLRNPTVHHTLVNMRRVVNALIKKYGEIDYYHIETTRELKKTFEEREKIKLVQADNQYSNLQLKELLLKKYPNIFKNIYKISKDDLLKYKLWQEQNGLDIYTNEIIPETKIFDPDYEVDHIAPYSKSFDDNYTNKVLTARKMNQDKGDRVPKEAFGKEGFKLIEQAILHSNLSQKKIENLNLNSINDIDEEFRDSNIIDTSYIAKLTKKLIEQELKPKDVIMSQGIITDKLKTIWNLKGFTHSYINEQLYNRITFLYDDVEIKKDSLIINMNVKETKEPVHLELKYTKPVKDRELDPRKKNINECIEYFMDKPSILEAELQKYKDNNIKLFIETISGESKNINEANKNDKFLTLSVELTNFIINFQMQKNRDNNLHHALDAIVIACTTRSIIQRLSTYNASTEKATYVDENGEIIDIKFDEPYKGFKDEVRFRVYERNKSKLVEELNKLPYYQNHQLSSSEVKVLYPVKKPDVYKTGGFFKETVFGYKEFNGIGYITKRVSVNKLNLKNVESIFGKDFYKDNNAKIYEACRDWLEKYGVDNEEHPYPIHPDTKNPIKNVVLVETTNIQSRVKIKENEDKYSSNNDNVRVDLYRKKNSDMLVMVPIYYYQILSENMKKKGKTNKEIMYQIMWAQGENGNEFISGEKLENDYVLLARMPRNSLIEIELKNGNKGICYSAGATSGMFEIYSIIGDGTDVVGQGISNILKDRYLITISQIKSIKVRSISAIGELN